LVPLGRLPLAAAEKPTLASITIPKPDLDGKSILVTGGTGSFGKAFIRHVLKHYKPRRLAVFSRDELKQWEMAAEFPIENFRVRYLIGDVRDAARLDMAMRGVDYVIHAAALKQVPTAEYNPFECIHTNVIGAENIVQAALRNKVQRVIALSTDKAANPINLYGASKLASDKIFVAGNNLSGTTDILFAVVRYGNVIGSRGSVVPLFRDLIAKGADSLPLTDERMTRFWITLNQGVEFVLSCLGLTRGGEIFVPKIPSMRMVDLAKAMAPQIPHKIVGIRPGEKLHEVMVTEDDSRSTVELADRYVIEPQFHWWKRRSFAEDGAVRVADGFRYASDTNKQWLDVDGLNRMLQEPGS
jgi:UDP-N-acetylglucosamine 4,6-dehydratase